MSVEQAIRVLAYAALAPSLAGAVYCLAALTYHHAAARLSPPAQVLFWRVVAVKLAAIALFTLDLAAHTA